VSEKSLFCGINKPGDPSSLSEMEKKHTPVIECPDTVKAGEPFTVKVKVGEIPHVMEEAHHIQWIDLYSGQSNFIARIDLTPVFTKAEFSVTLVKGGKHEKSTLRAVERCNMHGLWESTKEINIQN
jgi:superoxide reductase